MRSPRTIIGRLGPGLPDLLAALVFAVLARRWLTRLTDFLVNDDEGSYLYAAWRISLGERLYCDFLTPQLPAFLLPGGALMWVTGPEVWPARALAVVAALLAAVLVWATARRLFGPWVALIAGAALLLHPDVFESGRIFRSEPFMLLFQAAGVFVFARAALPRPEAHDPPHRLGLAVSGALFGIATLTKLFGPLPLVGLIAWLLFDGRGRGRPLGAMAADAAAAIGACGAVVAVGMGAFLLGGCDVLMATVGHHEMQNAGAAPLDVLRGGLRMFGLYARDAGRAVPAAAAIAIALVAWRDGDRRAMLFGWQLPTAVALLVLSRDRFPRHLFYLAPAIATLFGLAIIRLGGLGRATGGGRAGGGGTAVALATALAVAVLGTWWLFDRDYLWSRSEDGTHRAADFIALTTAPDDIVLSDYSELNFYARRPTTYSAASLSSGAARSGQISWSRIRAEFEALGREPALIVREIGSPYSHLAQLHPDDAAAMEAWLEANTVRAGTLRRDAQVFEVRAPVASAESLPVRARVGESLRLLAAVPDRTSAGSGDQVDVLTAWAADGTPADTLVATVRVTDGDGRVWAQADDALRASGARTTERWAPDELTAHRIALDLPLGLPPGRYDVSLGVYRDSDLTRLVLFDTRDGADHTSTDIGSIEIVPWRPRSAGGAAAELSLERVSSGAGSDSGLEVIGVSISTVSHAGDDPATSGDLDAGGTGVIETEPGESGTAEADPRLSSVPDADPGRVGSGAIEAGTLLPIEVAWLAVKPDTDIDARFTLADPDSGAVAADHTYALGIPGAPSATWPAGTVALQRFGLPVLGNAASGEYVLSVRHIGPDGTWLGEAVELGRVEVEARDLRGVVFDLDRPDEARFDVRFGEVGALVGAAIGRDGVDGPVEDDPPGEGEGQGSGESEVVGDVEGEGDVENEGEGEGEVDAPPIRAGSAAEITLVWRAISPSEWPYAVSVQILDERGRPIAQSDQQPTTPDGTVRPTFGWIPGEIVRDRHRIDIPLDALLGPAEIAVTLYRPETGRRLPARSEATDGPRVVDELARVGRITIGR